MRKGILLSWIKTADNRYQLTFYRNSNYNKTTYETGALLHLDHTIGEYNSMTLIEEVEFKQLDHSEDIGGLKTLDNLKNEIDALR
jgi:hypothetical protein